jgi:glycogen debranching enzyme
MDARIGDWVVTPRSGKPVEIQALWYNALKIMEDLAQRFGDEGLRQRCATLASIASGAFNHFFWNKERNCLYDVIEGSQPDPTIRPNQIFAASLHYSMLSTGRARAVVEIVERELLTPVGLRTLSPLDSRYRPRYEGDQYSRDSAYHQGTVWPWLLGSFITAYVRVNGGTPAAREHAHGLLRGLESRLGEAGLGQISEIFDADAPHLPRGCFAQAWSVAEILRALCEDVYQISSVNQPVSASS